MKQPIDTNNTNNVNDDCNIDENNIRSPDPVIQTKLIDTPSYIYNNTSFYYTSSFNEYNTNIDDVELETCINESVKDYEEKQMEIINGQIRERQSQLDSVLLKLKKVSMVDKEFLQVYELLEPVLMSYINLEFDSYKFDVKTYEHIQRYIKTIRISNEERNVLYNIIKHQ